MDVSSRKGGSFGSFPSLLSAPQWIITLDGSPPVNFYRCERDGYLVTDRMIEQGQHLGHRLRDPVHFGWVEWLLVNLRIIR